MFPAREELWSSWKDEKILDAKMKEHEDSVIGHELVFLERNRD